MTDEDGTPNDKFWEENPVYFSYASRRTLDDWTGGGYYQRVVSFELFGFKFVLWRKH